MSNAPNPGSDAAIDAGCICPVLDNCRGRGYYGNPNVFVLTAGCPVHDPQRTGPRGPMSSGTRIPVDSPLNDPAVTQMPFSGKRIRGS